MLVKLGHDFEKGGRERKADEGEIMTTPDMVRCGRKLVRGKDVTLGKIDGKIGRIKAMAVMSERRSRLLDRKEKGLEESEDGRRRRRTTEEMWSNRAGKEKSRAGIVQGNETWRRGRGRRRVR